MATRLEPLNLVDYTGGLNLRKNQFQLAENESAEMLNITVDPLGGVYTRKGWECFNENLIPIDPADWDPRRAFLAQLSDGTDLAYLATNNEIWMTDPGLPDFTNSGVACSAITHMADFAIFADDTYIACGTDNHSYIRHGSDDLELLTALSTGNFNNDYLNPIGGIFPKCELVEAHAGYAFVGHTSEADVNYPNRIRWSHPTSQGDWAETDFIDIGVGGSRITALMSYEDHLLIFKADSVWALYGYNSESWQLVQKDSTIGTPGPQAVTRSETAVFFYSASDLGGVYLYAGERPQEISEPVRRVFADIAVTELVWVGWIARRLWVPVPWSYDGPTADSEGVLVFDPAVGEQGAWTYFNSAGGALGPIMAGSNIDSQARPMGVLRNTEMTCVVRLDARDQASDFFGEMSVLGAAAVAGAWDLSVILTADGRAILADGMPGIIPFHSHYRSPWLTAGWPTRKKSWRRPDFICRRTEADHRFSVASFRDYEELNPRRRSTIDVQTGGGTVWGHFDWTETETAGPDAPQWGDGAVAGAMIRRGSSFGMCRALQLRVEALTPGARWGIDGIIMKYVLRRFR
jgi:hypothetical protein